MTCSEGRLLESSEGLWFAGAVTEYVGRRISRSWTAGNVISREHLIIQEDKSIPPDYKWVHSLVWMTSLRKYGDFLG